MTRPAWQHLLGIVSGLLVALACRLDRRSTGVVPSLYLAAVVAWQARNLIRFEHWLRLRSILKPPDMGGLWGDVVAIANRLYQRKRFHKRRALTLLRELRRMTSAMPDGTILLGPDPRDPLVQPDGRAMARAAAQARLRHPHRQPDPAPGVRRVRRPAAARGPGPRIHMPNLGDRWFAFDLVTTSDSRPAVADRPRRHQRGAARVHAPRLRRQRVARTALAADGRAWLPRHAGRRSASLDAAWREPVREMQRQSERMHSIVSDLLELSRLEASRGEAETEPIDVAGLLALMRKEVLARPDRPGDVRTAARIGRAAARRRVRAAFDLPEPDHQRREVHAAGRRGDRALLDRSARQSRGRHRHGHRHPGGAPAAAHGALLPGRRRALAQAGRLRARAGHREACPAASRRATSRSRARKGKGSTFTCHFPPERVLVRKSPVVGGAQVR